MRQKKMSVEKLLVNCWWNWPLVRRRRDDVQGAFFTTTICGVTNRFGFTVSCHGVKPDRVNKSGQTERVEYIFIHYIPLPLYAERSSVSTPCENWVNFLSFFALSFFYLKLYFMHNPSSKLSKWWLSYPPRTQCDRCRSGHKTIDTAADEFSHSPHNFVFHDPNTGAKKKRKKKKIRNFLQTFLSAID